MIELPRPNMTKAREHSSLARTYEVGGFWHADIIRIDVPPRQSAPDPRGSLDVIADRMKGHLFPQVSNVIRPGIDIPGTNHVR